MIGIGHSKNKNMFVLVSFDIHIDCVWIAERLKGDFQKFSNLTRNQHRTMKIIFKKKSPLLTSSRTSYVVEVEYHTVFVFSVP